MYEIRKQKIMELLEARDHISVKELKEDIAVSAMTIQRDLTKMEQEGLIIKGFGEISRVKGIYLERLALSQEKDIQEDQSRIAAYAASFVEDGDTVLLSNGNIIFNLAKRLKEKHIIAVTPSIRAGLALCKGKGTVYMTGGTLSQDGKHMGGEYAKMVMEHFFADKAFLTCASISPQGDMCEYTEEESFMKRLIIEHAQHVYLLIEAEKFGVRKFFRSEHLERVSNIITDRSPPENCHALLERYGGRLHILDQISTDSRLSPSE